MRIVKMQRAKGSEKERERLSSICRFYSFHLDTVERIATFQHRVAESTRPIECECGRFSTDTIYDKLNNRSPKTVIVHIVSHTDRELVKP